MVRRDGRDSDDALRARHLDWARARTRARARSGALPLPVQGAHEDRFDAGPPEGGELLQPVARPLRSRRGAEGADRVTAHARPSETVDLLTPSPEPRVPSPESRAPSPEYVRARRAVPRYHPPAFASIVLL